MKEHPIIFSGPMVKAILEGRKTQTRRMLSRRNTTIDGHTWPKEIGDDAFDWSGVKVWEKSIWGEDHHLRLEWPSEGTFHRVRTKLEPGDLLWLRETWTKWPAYGESGIISYKAGPSPLNEKNKASKWKTSIFMPRWASRITLEVTETRIERLQEISEEDAMAEGARGSQIHPMDPLERKEYLSGFCHIWKKLYPTSPKSWDANPWVVVISFKQKESQ